MTESIHALSGAYVVDALDDPERDAFEQHLPGCLDCQAEVASLREAAVTMAHDAALTPPPAMRDHVLASIQHVRPLAPTTVEHTAAEQPGRDAVVVPLRRHRFRMALVAAAAAVVAVLGIGSATHWGHQPSSVSQVTAADRVLAADDAAHQSVALADGAKATLVRSVSQKRAVLVTEGMSKPPSGKAFELWLRNAQGEIVPAGLMHSGGDQKVLLKGDAADATWAGITVEPSGGSQQPTTKPIVSFDFANGGA